MPAQELINEPEDITINHHDEMDQILGNPPSWILKWGITLVLLAVLIFAALAWIIKYPDIIPAKVVLTTENPVIPVMAKTSGSLQQIFVANNQVVAKNDVLALLENPASFQDVDLLDSLLEQATQDMNWTVFSPSILRKHLRLGNLQPQYASLIQKLRANNYFLKQQDTQQKTQSLQTQMHHIQMLTTNLMAQQKNLAQEVQLAKKDLERHQQLYQDQVVSEVELERVEAAYLQIKRQLETAQNSIIANNIQLEQLETQILDLSQARNNRRSEQELHILADIDALRGAIQEWEATYLIKAPIDGQVSFSKVWSEEQFIQINTAIFSIVPNHEDHPILGRAQLPIANSGKVKVGQTVNIQLDGFPYQEYGVVKGSVQHISLVPLTSPNEPTSTYILEIALPSDLRTTYDKSLPFRQSMMGTANIITEDRRILIRVFDQLNSILRNS